MYKFLGSFEFFLSEHCLIVAKRSFYYCRMTYTHASKTFTGYPYLDSLIIISKKYFSSLSRKDQRREPRITQSSKR